MSQYGSYLFTNVVPLNVNSPQRRNELYKRTYGTFAIAPHTTIPYTNCMEIVGKIELTVRIINVIA
jgi:hypothetical protein